MMNSSYITSPIAVLTKLSKDSINIKPNNDNIGIELNDERTYKLYETYCCLLIEQREENRVNNLKNGVW